ncbi:hypothetical protein FRB94_010249 [Tulasnella sp. JGI-2019a]|nr:hypothetical protein FRB94_010249 [Tulasnella sp. JGI-2019a]KAG8999139.1 hypothetical protein FRB93_013296 [Tulasnella sp. JGI-2019a]KAG9030672.1 hypothetical protein FRB95_003633 [Tulasnella sp. JGI-2019a]
MAQWPANSAGGVGDGWDSNVPSQVAPSSKSKDPVPDDWDADDDASDAQARPESTHTLWEEANTRDPQPKVILTSTAGSSTPSQIPDSLLNAPKVILKRPTSSSPSPSSPPPGAPVPKSIQEREASYQAARERIFGAGSGTSTPTATDEPISSRGPPVAGNITPVPTSTVIRPPRGPPPALPDIAAGNNVEPAAPSPVAGFAGRVAKKRGHGRTISDLEGIRLGNGGSPAGPPRPAAPTPSMMTGE